MEKPITISEPDQRHLAWEGSYNVRDVGGYSTLDGRLIRWRTLLRAGNLSYLSRTGQRLLLDYPVRAIIDLRRTEEVSRAPSLFAQSPMVKYIHIPLLEDEQQVRQAQSLQAIYRLILETSQEPIKHIVEAMAQQAIFPCLVHCTGGKDRTGLIIALVLSLGNVSALTIAQDYSLSEQYLAPIVFILRSQIEQYEDDGQRFAWLIEARQETMLETLAYLDERYGGVRGYLAALGITAEQMDAISRKLVE